MIRPVYVMIPGLPKGKGRPKVAVRGKHVTLYTPSETVEYERKIKAEASVSMLEAGLDPFAGPVELKLEIWMPIPPSYSKAKAAACRSGQMAPTKKPDLDNVVKAVCDAFNETVWNDDTQVVLLQVSKMFADNPCVVAIVTPLALKGSSS